MPITLKVNGETKKLDVDPETPLLWVLRDTLGLTGTKFGCGIGVCGACTVHVEGAAEQACSVPIGALAGKRVVTIEGLSRNRSHPLQRAWIAEDVPQCGYCQPGMIMAVAALLRQNPKPTEDDINTNITNICRCGTYSRIRRAIKRVAGA